MVGNVKYGRNINNTEELAALLKSVLTMFLLLFALVYRSAGLRGDTLCLLVFCEQSCL